MLNEIMPLVRHALSRVVIHNPPTKHECNMIEATILAAANGRLQLRKKNLKPPRVSAMMPLPEASAYCGYSFDGFKKLLQRKIGPKSVQARRRGKRLFRKNDLDDWIEENTRDTSEVLPVQRKKTKSKVIATRAKETHGLDPDLM